MSHIHKSAGKIAIDAYTDGHPVSFNVRYSQWNGERSEFRMRVEDLHDLRYCIDRILGQLASAGVKP